MILVLAWVIIRLILQLYEQKQKASEADVQIIT